MDHRAGPKRASDYLYPPIEPFDQRVIDVGQGPFQLRSKGFEIFIEIGYVTPVGGIADANRAAAASDGLNLININLIMLEEERFLARSVELDAVDGRSAIQLFKAEDGIGRNLNVRGIEADVILKVVVR